MTAQREFYAASSSSLPADPFDIGRPTAIIVPLPRVTANGDHIIDTAAGGKLGPAMGVLFGLGIGALMWLGIGLLAWRLFG